MARLAIFRQPSRRSVTHRWDAISIRRRVLLGGLHRQHRLRRPLFTTDLHPFACPLHPAPYRARAGRKPVRANHAGCEQNKIKTCKSMAPSVWDKKEKDTQKINAKMTTVNAPSIFVYTFFLLIFTFCVTPRCRYTKVLKNEKNGKGGISQNTDQGRGGTWGGVMAGAS